MTTVAHVLLATLQFFLINWLGGLSLASGYHQITFVQNVEDSPLFNVVFRVLSPAVFLVLTATVWYAIGADDVVQAYWHVTVFYIALRWTFNVVMGRSALLRWRHQVLTGGLAIGVSYLIATKLLADRSAVLPSARALTDELWIVVIGFLYLTASRVSWPSFGPSIDEQRSAYLHRRFLKFRQRYGAVVSATSANRLAEATSYAIMIYESFNRPSIYQWIERTVLFPTGLARTLGPMQVTTSVSLPSAALVREGVQRVNKAIADAFEELKPEWGDELTIAKRRDPVAGIELPPDTASFADATVDDVPSWYESQLVERAAAKYNIRSDYPGEIGGIVQFLREHYIPRVEGGAPAATG